MKWEEALIKYGRLAMAQGKKLEFIPKKDKYKVYWRITLTSIVESGQEELVEED